MHLSARALIVERGGRTVAGPLDFDVAAGRPLLLKGPNGAGKTSLIRVLAGLARPASGTLDLTGGASEASLGEQAHYIGHLNAIKLRMTALENVRFWSGYLGGRAADAEAALDRLGILGLADIPAAYMSAGQRRRVALARLLSAPRPVWLLDEPTVSLDAASTAVLAELIAEHAGGGGIVVAATHIDMGISADVLELKRRPA